MLALLGCVLVDVNLRSFHKAALTCAYLPGKSNVHLGFWAFIMFLVPLTIVGARYELRTFGQPARYLWMVAILAFADAVQCRYCGGWIRAEQSPTHRFVL